MKFFVSKKALVEEGVKIGDNTKIWHFSHLMLSAQIGEICVIGEHVLIGKKVIVGNNVHIANGVNIYEVAVIKDNVFIGNNVSFTNVLYPRAWRKAVEYLPIIVEENVTINANAVIVGGVRIGANSTVGEGAIVLHNVSSGGFVISSAAHCICNREECKECRERKDKNIKKYFKKYASTSA